MEKDPISVKSRNLEAKLALWSQASSKTFWRGSPCEGPRLLWCPLPSPELCHPWPFERDHVHQTQSIAYSALTSSLLGGRERFRKASRFVIDFTHFLVILHLEVLSLSERGKLLFYRPVNEILKNKLKDY